MLRPLVAVLLVANLLMLAWQQGYLGASLGWPSQDQREPERLQRQVNPDQVRVLSPVAASAAMAEAAGVAGDTASQAASASADGNAGVAARAAAPAASTAAQGAAGTACLEAGPFAATELPAAEAALRAAGLPAGSWAAAASQRKGNYIVYMGRYADDEALSNKQGELKRLNVESQPITNFAGLQPGLVLGRFDNKDAADAAQVALTQRGVRTSRVVTVSPGVVVSTLRVAAADEALRTKLKSLKLPPSQLGFVPCPADSRKG